MRSDKSAVGLRGAGMLAVCALLITAAGCGGSGSSNNNNNNGNKQVIAGPGPNVVTLVADPGPLGSYTNGSFVSANICLPGTTTCQTIDHLLVDTGSFGLRILSSAGGGELTLALPTVKDASNRPIGECVQFIDTSFLWGPVALADVQLSSEVASSVPVHVVGDTSFNPAPISCSTGGIDRDTLQQLGANGIIGVGGVQYDCGSICASGPTIPTPLYYACPNTGCIPSFLPLAQQVQNPVALFATDNNGVIVELPSVPSAGAPSVTGALVFGIGTQSNNALGSASVLTLDNSLNFTTTFKNVQYTNSFVDSGSNGIFFLDSTTTGMATCGFSDFFYCPSSTQNFTATNTGQNMGNTPVSFSIGNLGNFDPANFVFNNLGGPSPNSFDWGLPFFLGRNVFVSIAGKNTPSGTTPFVAY